MQSAAVQEKGVKEIEEEPGSSSSNGIVLHDSENEEEKADVECPLCLGSGAVLTCMVEEGWQSEDMISQPPPPLQSYWDSKSARRRRQGRRAERSCFCGRPCRAAIVSILYITLATILGFLGFSFYPRNPDFDIVDIHFTKLQLRWERDHITSDIKTAAEAIHELEFNSFSERDYEQTLSDRIPKRVRQDWRASFEGDATSLALQKLAANTDVLGSAATTQKLTDLEVVDGGQVESWGTTSDENRATIFGRRLVLDIDLMVTVLVKNPNKVGVHYQASSLDIIYKGKKLGDALLPPGQQAAASTTIITVPAQLNGLSTIGMSFALLRDWENKSVEMDIAARFTGTVDLIKLIPHEFIADMHCDVFTNPRNLMIIERKCEWKYGGRL